ncbi:ABC transporter permease [Homoserinibacter sp. GY 40078]|uniref:ABC transporter permease n=1 Tax=Homoserinibacter sp. GY 40078 TaxID=2603275 RepID=UPI0011C9E41F|nr:ABC transporter permease [Homoserinibacter sp. GY 40078]TXK17487.1 ABC transporter permease [Homoserinibacter sp. GY 40078]
MIRSLSQRLLGLVIVFFGVTFIIYAMVFALPGDPIRALGGERPISDTTVAALRAAYHLDDPLIVQYLRYIGGLLTGDFGTDFLGRSVGEQMLRALPVTIVLGLSAWALEIIVGLGLGIIAALRRDTWIDRGILITTILATSIPVFVVGVSAQLLFGVRWGILPVAGDKAGWPVAFILPAAVIAIYGLAVVSRLIRTSMIDNLGMDYVRTARAKGLAPSRIVGVHVLRNSAIPAVTFLATDLGYLLGGAVVVEGIFNLPGIGNLLFSAIRAHEGPTVVGISTALILVFLLTSALVDFLHTLLDPRIRHD